MSNVISHTTVMIDRQTSITAKRLPGGQIEVTFGKGDMYDPEGGTTASLIIADPLATISSLISVLQTGFVEAHRHPPTNEQSAPREKPNHEPPGAHRHLHSI
jgi:hypothetical protein